MMIIQRRGEPVTLLEATVVGRARVLVRTIAVLTVYAGSRAEFTRVVLVIQ